ncbi:MFS transporter [Kibdelosporangium persicum]|uniref:MFS family arabinose efflux permease n=1 Tax=Kibdelosporangium persicum TaxID=2698649 RepID=A0ABX2F3U5_9PSEU|nr:MFS transporter [Kibdelosporangium persicum]NRN65917.1 putative MFS family arabinose efflux permease [Kibdelosporangium persicum]
MAERVTSWWRIAFICAVLLLEGMSSSSINVQIGALESHFRLSPALLQLVVGAFLIAYAGLLPLAGRWVDTRGGRTVFLLGVALFGLGCVLCAAAMSGLWLVVGRFAQGAGAALSAPAAVALIIAGLPPGRTRNQAMGLYAAMGAVGFSLGLVLPAFVVTELGWRASFLVYLPVVAAMLVVGQTIERSPASGGRVDPFAAIAVTVAMMLAVHAIGDVGQAPWWGTTAQLAVAVALGLGGRRLFPAEVTRSAGVLSGSFALAGVFSALTTSMYLASLALQADHSAFEAGLALVPQSVSNAIATMFGARLVTRFGARKVLTAGMSMIVAALGYLGTAGMGLPYAAGLLPAFIVIGVSIALCYPASTIMAVDAVEPVHHGTAAGMLTTFQNVGGAAGLAVATAAAVVPLPGNGVPPEPGQLLCMAMMLFFAAIVVLIWRFSRRRLLSTRD